MQLGIRPHDNCRNISGVGERVGKEGDEQDVAQEEEEIDADAAEDAPVKIARDQGDPTLLSVSVTTRRTYRTDHGSLCVSRARAKKRATEGKNAETRVANHTCTWTTKLSDKKATTVTRQRCWCARMRLPR